MIISTTLEVLMFGKNIKHFLEKGYDNIKHGDKIIVKVTDLMISSNQSIEVCCDYCNITKNIKYQKYIKNTKNLSLKYACSKKCSNEKSRKTCLEKYGVDNALKSKEIQKKKENTNLEKYGCKSPLSNEVIKNKIKETNIERYGYENVFQSDIIKDRIKETNIERYGYACSLLNDNIKEKSKDTIRNLYNVDNVSQSNIIKEKKKETSIINYGVEYPQQLDIIKERIKENNLIKYGVEHFTQSEIYQIARFDYMKEKYSKLIFISKNKSINTIRCDNNHDYLISTHLLNSRLKQNINVLCTICNPISQTLTSSKETEIYNYVKCFYQDAIQSYREHVLEIDIFIPSLNIGIEYNGIYWHSDDKKEKNYHANKTQFFKDKGIEILHIWEDDYLYKQKIVLSIIKNRLNLIKNKIFARKCVIKEVKDSKLVRQFLDINHIQGYTQSSIKLGLYFNDELVSLMTFGYRHTNKKKEYELIRFCNKINTNVVGASSKLFKYFLNNYNYDNIISYADISMFNGNVYKKLGFKLLNRTSLNYYWVIDGIKHHRYNFNKKKLEKMGYDINNTEDYIMRNNLKASKIWSCGMDKYLYIKN